MLASSAPVLGVMDADLQHDESILSAMLESIRTGQYDVVVATRHGEGGSMGEFSDARVALSNLGLKLSRFVCGVSVTDPMSGFFLLRRSYLEEVVHNISAIGFKILVDLLASSPRPVRVGEVSYTFRKRQHGESKLDVNVGLEYLYLLLDKLLGRFVPVRFITFALVGTTGVLLHLLLMALLFVAYGLPFATAQAIATFFAMLANYVLNNTVTYRDLRLKGTKFFVGLVIFCIACSLGAVANVATAEFVRNHNLPWFLASAFGLTISAVWNFGVTGVFVWRVRRRRLARQFGRS
ncbi:MAG: GtrA family protein [Bryobacterales bacterium]|nr:GtrA family protein [Bryobacterales bacterium]